MIWASPPLTSKIAEPTSAARWHGHEVNRVASVGLSAECETFKGGRPSSARATDRKDVLVVERVLRIGERDHRRAIVAQCSTIDADDGDVAVRSRDVGDRDRFGFDRSRLVTFFPELDLDAIAQAGAGDMGVGQNVEVFFAFAEQRAAAHRVAVADSHRGFAAGVVQVTGGRDGAEHAQRDREQDGFGGSDRIADDPGGDEDGCQELDLERQQENKNDTAGCRPEASRFKEGFEFVFHDGDTSLLLETNENSQRARRCVFDRDADHRMLVSVLDDVVTDLGPVKNCAGGDVGRRVFDEVEHAGDGDAAA